MDLQKQLPTKVLLVDDDPVFRESLRILLNQFPDEWVCYLAGSVKEAVEQMSARRIELAIVDVHLPDGKATDVIRSAGTIPCMLCTQERNDPNFMKVFEDPLLKHNITGYVTKPVNSDAIWHIRFGLQIGRERQERNRLVAEATSRLEEERRVIAQNLHDQMGASLTQLTWTFCGIESIVKDAGSLAPDLADKLLAKIEDGKRLVKDAHSEVSSVVTKLRPEAVNVVGLYSAINYMVSQWKDMAPDVKFNVNLCPELRNIDISRAGIIYRMVQEGLTNTMRHTTPDEVNLCMEYRGTELVFALMSHGAVLEHTDKYALTSLRERTTSLGGVLQFNCDIKSGISNLEVTIPI